MHGYVTPTLIESTTKPHNPSIDYDLWLKWNPQARRRERGRHERGRSGRHPPDPRLVRERQPAAGKRALRQRPPARTRPGRGLGRLGPLLHTDVLAARRAERLDGRNVQPHRHALRRAGQHHPPAAAGSARRSPSTPSPGRRCSSTCRIATTCCGTSSRPTGAASRTRRGRRAAKRPTPPTDSGCASIRWPT